MAHESILIVDDNEVNLKLARLLLEMSGYIVKTSEDAEQALEVLQSFRPDLILLDIQLPGISGLELARKLKADDRFNEIILVALTAYAMKGDEEKMLNAGCDGYIAKPLDTRTLAVSVAEYLKRRQVAGG